MEQGSVIAPLRRRWQADFTLDVRPAIVVFGRRLHSFRGCGAAGALLASALATALIAADGLSYGVAGLLLASGFATFFALALATKIVTGRETLVYYHHEVAILLAAAAVLCALDRPMLPYLDANALWLGVFLSCGRGGCLMVGCCHGRPHHWGVRYGEAHALEGFPRAYVGVRLFPVQALEAVVVIVIVAAGVLLHLRGAPAGAVLSTYVVTYSAARIWLEELRGDAARPYWRGFSEGQWTSLLLVAGVLLGEWRGRLPWSTWHFAVGAGAALSWLWLASARRQEDAVLHPWHACQVAAVLKMPRTSQASVAVHRTSLTIGISTQALAAPPGTHAVLYSMSRADRRMTAEEATALSKLVMNLAGTPGRPELRRGHGGVFHLIVRDARVDAPACEGATLAQSAL